MRSAVRAGNGGDEHEHPALMAAYLRERQPLVAHARVIAQCLDLCLGAELKHRSTAWQQVPLDHVQACSRAIKAVVAPVDGQQRVLREATGLLATHPRRVGDDEREELVLS